MSSEPVKPQARLKAGELLALALQRWASFRQQLAQWLQPDNLQQLRPQVKFQAGVLAGFALLAAILLGVADLATRGVIELRLREDLQANLAQVVPAELHDNDLLQDSVMLDARDNNLGSEQIEVYLAKQAGIVNAVCFKFVAPDGYAGPITLVMGVDRNGEILGVRVISHVETPGLGDKIEVTKSKWVLGFNGKSLDNLTVEQWAVKKDGGVFDQFSGATITPRKVVQAIKRGLDFYKLHQAELLAAG
ncbi:electron transport complex subunit RsxG [Methylomonas sp. SURF-1]|uniref:Ion-translocating oxidoreductase complex subunit G n=1 Tax=Methylomonas aurea TaxID=2952224 RepID=A0ABT1UES4_9GAMM|nr:electron transport complex subunit RsxG [Methylomonas sp. SURF-1]MCQ8180363.1 electron transport complex subunit RsxG [Methylomonas sp. SURF-1]